MRRRVILAACGSMVGIPGTAWTQQTGRIHRVAWVAASSDTLKEPQALAFVQRLAELGYVEGRNLVLERRDLGSRLDRIPAVAAEVGKLRCDAYFGAGGEAVLSTLVQASPGIPIVFVAVDFDPVATGDVASLARPGGRVTGVTALQSTLPAKRLELLKELMPDVTRFAVFSNADTSAQLALVQGTARRMGMAAHVIDLKRPPFDYDAAFADAVKAKAEALFVLGSGLWVPGRRTIVNLALKARLPTVFHQSGWVDAGGLMSYGFNFPSMWRRGADMVASVLRGTKAGDIPMEQPTTFELVLNRKTAKSLGLKVPQPLLLRADRVIE